MPCRSDHMEPNAREAESKLVADLINWLMNRLKRHDEIPKDVFKATQSMYGNQSETDVFTAMLCKLIRGLTPEEENKWIYNGRDPWARKLADWWERHQEVDRKRVEQVERDRALAKAMETGHKKIVAANLTPEEYEAMRQHFRAN